MAEVTDVPDFWFSEPYCNGYSDYQEAWFGKAQVFDDEVRSRSEELVLHPSIGGFYGWQETSEDALACTIALDQFSRNIFRGLPQAFAADAKAWSIAGNAIDLGFDRELLTMQRLFFYLPFQHSKNFADQRRGLPNMVKILEGFDGALYDRFVRFPHCNRILGCVTSATEAAFLEEPRSSFGWRFDRIQ